MARCATPRQSPVDSLELEPHLWCSRLLATITRAAGPGWHRVGPLGLAYAGTPVENDDDPQNRCRSHSHHDYQRLRFPEAAGFPRLPLILEPQNPLPPCVPHPPPVRIPYSRQVLRPPRLHPFPEPIQAPSIPAMMIPPSKHRTDAIHCVLIPSICVWFHNAPYLACWRTLVSYNGAVRL